MCILDMTCEEYDQRVQEMMAQDHGKYYDEDVKRIENQYKLNLKLYHQYIEPLGVVDTTCEQFLLNYEDWTGNTDGPAHRREDERIRAMIPPTPVKIHRPKCPTCGSENVRRLDAMERGGSLLAFGIFSPHIGKTFKCNHCGYTW